MTRAPYDDITVADLLNALYARRDSSRPLAAQAYQQEIDTVLYLAHLIREARK